MRLFGKRKAQERSEQKPAAQDAKSAKLYLYLLMTDNHLPLLADKPRTERALKEIARGYEQGFGQPAQVLGRMIHKGGLPTGPEAFVVSTALLQCKASSLKFDSQRDEISYSIDQLEGSPIGTIRVQINA
jgi:hypothetical protein